MSQDLIDTLIPLPSGTAVHAVRHQRDKVVTATQGSYAGLFEPSVSGLSPNERWMVAHEMARLSGSALLQNHYRTLLGPLPVPTSRQQALVHFAGLLASRPVEGDRGSLLALQAAGLSTPDIVLLAQLIAFVSYQVRVVAGLQAMVSVGPAPQTQALSPGPDAAFVHPANLPPPGEPLRLNGYTSETLGWKAWLPVLDLSQASAEQLAVLQGSHPKAMSSDYYRLLVHQAGVLEQRSTVFNAIMYAPGGLSRAERELASAVVSRINGCVYCASVHAQRFEQLSKRNDVIAQVFVDPEQAGTSPRERALIRLSIDLTRQGGAFSAEGLAGVRAAGLADLEILDLVHAVAIFAWANRLMLNLGEPVYGG